VHKFLITRKRILAGSRRLATTAGLVDAI